MREVGGGEVILGDIDKLSNKLALAGKCIMMMITSSNQVIKSAQN